MGVEGEAFDIDDILDRLPNHARNAVLDAMGQPAPEPEKREHKFGHVGWLALLICTILLWTVPLTLVGVVACLTIVLAPLGVALIAFGCMPLTVIISKMSGHV